MSRYCCQGDVQNSFDFVSSWIWDVKLMSRYIYHAIHYSSVICRLDGEFMDLG